MPRRRQRFADLERQFRDSGGTASPGSRLAGYIDFKKGINKITVEKKLTGTQRKRYGFGIIPFGLSPAATTPERYAAAITSYSYQQLTAVGLTKAKLGYEDIVAGTQQFENFYPALLRVFVSTGIKSNPISGVTKEKYSRMGGATYSFPFGRTTTSVTDAVSLAVETSVDTVDAEDVKSSLMILLKAGAATTKVASVSYEPEVFRVGKPDLASPP